MTPEVQPEASMGRLVMTYLVTLVFSAVIFLAVIWALARYAAASYPVGVMLFLLPMMAAMQSGNSFFKQTGRAATLTYSVMFGVITTAVLLAGVLALWQAGYLDSILYQIDAGAFQRGEIGVVMLPLLMVVGALGLFCNILMFWAAARGQVKQQERKARKAAAKAGKKI